MFSRGWRALDRPFTESVVEDAALALRTGQAGCELGAVEHGVSE
jgi:hypothetical protein